MSLSLKNNSSFKIGIDARLYGHKHAGIGRYTQNLVSALVSLYPETHFTLLVNHDNLPETTAPNLTFVKTDIRHYSLAEQIRLPKILNNLDIDLLHTPHFNVPIFYNKPFVVTIHDLLWHEKTGLKVTTLPAWKYFIKYFGYRHVSANAIKKSAHIFTPTKHIKQKISDRFPISRSKISVTYEAVDIAFGQAKTKPVKKYPLDSPYILYTGSLYPHKNADVLLDVLTQTDLNLLVASARNIFLDKFKQKVSQRDLQSRVKFLGFVPDSDLAFLYQKARACVLPSQSEGFGLTGLEAMASGGVVVCNQHPVLKEVYGSAALFVDTTKASQIVGALQKLDSKTQRQSLLEKSKLQVKKYSWETMAKQTYQGYQSVLT